MSKSLERDICKYSDADEISNPRLAAMNPELNRLVPAIVSRVLRNGGYVTKTKLLKLLYLFDVEFYRVHREIFTRFDWRYYHLGPWTPEYDTFLANLTNSGLLVSLPSTHPDYEAIHYRTPEEVRLFGILAPQDEAILRKVLNIWGEKSTAEILNYVYFRTEPIERGERNKRLNFSLIPSEAPKTYVRTSSGKTSKEIERLRAEFRARTRDLPDGLVPVVDPPKYDDSYFEFLENLENDILR